MVLAVVSVVTDTGKFEVFFAIAAASSEWHGFGHGFSRVRVRVRVPGPVTNLYPPVRVAGLP